MNPSGSAPQTHHHVFDSGDPAGKRGTRLAMGITALMMGVEMVAGGWFSAMALWADAGSRSVFIWSD